MNLAKICEETRSLIITQLIGLGEAQREIYDKLKTQQEFKDELTEAYKLHQLELELLIKYQQKINKN